MESQRGVVPTCHSSHVVHYFSSVSLHLSPGSCPEWKLFRNTTQQHVASISVATMARSTLTWWWTMLAWPSHAARRGSCSFCASSTPVWRRGRRPPRDISSSLVGLGIRKMGGCLREVQRNTGMKFHQDYVGLVCLWVFNLFEMYLFITDLRSVFGDQKHMVTSSATVHWEQLAVTLSSFLFSSRLCLTHTPHTHNLNSLSSAISSPVIPLWFASTQMFAHSQFMHLIGLFKGKYGRGIQQSLPSHFLPTGIAGIDLIWGASVCKCLDCFHWATHAQPFTFFDPAWCWLSAAVSQLWSILVVGLDLWFTLW